MGSMNRRAMLKLTSAGSVGALATAPATRSAATPIDQDAPNHVPNHAPIPRWSIFELTLAGPASGNPFTDVQFGATFSLGNRSISVDGFYDGSGVYKIRFMPDTEGDWRYSTSSNIVELAAQTGAFSCLAPLPGAHGPVSVRNTHHFAHADGTPFFPFGTTCYAWVHQSNDLEEQTLNTLRTAPFNKLRMCVFPKSYEYNHNEPPLYPFERDADGKHDFARPNPAFFAHIERRIADLANLGIQADLILFHPYDRWGYATMSAEADNRYLRYVLARMSAFANIWWSLANEFDLMKEKSAQDFDRFFHIVEQHDPVPHLRSVHYSNTMYDYARPWVTHACLQTAQFDSAGAWLKTWNKPIVFDEVMYEGNLNRRWGNLSGEEMARRFWLGVLAGCYVTHGETYLDPHAAMDENATPTIWWAHGGALHGTSPARIGFLRKLVEQTAARAGMQARRTGLEAPSAAYYLNASTVAEDGKTIDETLYYFDFHQPIYYEFTLPEGQFTAELIDPWQMTITSLPGAVTGKTKLRLTGRPFQAIRFRRVS